MLDRVGFRGSNEGNHDDEFHKIPVWEMPSKLELSPIDQRGGQPRPECRKVRNLEDQIESGRNGEEKHKKRCRDHLEFWVLHEAPSNHDHETNDSDHRDSGIKVPNKFWDRTV